MSDQNLPEYAKPEFILEDGTYDHRGHALATEARIRELDAARKAPKTAPKATEPTRADLASVKDLSNTARTYQPADDAYGRTGVLATVQPAPGSRASVVRGEPGETDLVTLKNGMQVSLAQAEALGEVHRDGAGRFQNGPDPRFKEAPVAQPQADPDMGVQLAPEVEAGIGDVHTMLESHWGKGAAPALLSKLMATGVMPMELRNATDAAGVPYATVVEKIRAFAEATAEKVASVVEAEGVDNSEAFMEWARFARGPIFLQGLDLAFYTTGSLKGYRALAREYMESSSRTREKGEGGKPGDRVTAITEDGREVQTNRAAARKLGWRLKVD